MTLIESFDGQRHCQHRQVTEAQADNNGALSPGVRVVGEYETLEHPEGESEEYAETKETKVGSEPERGVVDNCSVFLLEPTDSHAKWIETHLVQRGLIEKHPPFNRVRSHRELNDAIAGVAKREHGKGHQRYHDSARHRYSSVLAECDESGQAKTERHLG